MQIYAVAEKGRNGKNQRLFQIENGNNVLKVIHLGYRSESEMSLYKGHLKFYYIVPLILLYSPFKFKEKIERDIPYLPS